MSRRFPLVRQAGVLGAALVLSATAGGCGASSSTSNAGGAFRGTITMWAGAYYTPQPATSSNPNPPTELAKLAKEWETTHPGITIKFLPVLPPTVQDTAWLETRIAAGQAPDVSYLDSVGIANHVIPLGTFVNLTPYFNKPNPYVPGNKAWGDLWTATDRAAVTASNGATYEVNADTVGTPIYYNKTMFAKAGITSTPTTWAQFMQDVHQLKAAGLTPMGWDLTASYYGNGGYAWLNNYFESNFYGNQLSSMRYDGQAGITALDEAIAVKKGLMGPANARFFAWWPAVRNLSQYFQRGYESAGSSLGKVGLAELFVQNQFAMYLGGSWDIGYIKSAHPNFQWGTFALPQVDSAVSSYATSVNTSNVIAGVGGGAFVYPVPTQKADHSMTPAKLKAVINWLQFITTPQHDQAIVNQVPGFLPIEIGTHPAPQLSQFAAQISGATAALSTEDGATLTPTELQTVYQTWEQYMLGQISLSQAKTTLLPVVQAAASQVIAQAEKSGINVQQMMNK
ncbi:MAG: extracellular solute-binding protein [Thermaerobacter sp.]|nr:extracellular solute-binding protein [Thermaerobacter sp.]